MRKLLVIGAALAATQLSPVLAADQAASGLIGRAEKAFASQLAQSHTSAGGKDGEATWIAEDAVYQYALGSIDVSLRVQGRAAVTTYLRALADAAPSAAIENIRFFPTLEPELVVAQYDLVPADDVAKRSSPLAIIQYGGRPDREVHAIESNTAKPASAEGA